MSKQPGEERQSRKPKSENRFYNFLSRSRSRSRTKDARLLPDSDPASSPSQGVRRTAVSPDSKPPARIPSRPISSTTTATNATVVPSTPKPRTRPVPTLPIPPASEPINSDLQIPTRPSTPKLPGARKKLHNLFGISLHSPRKPSFGLAVSQPSSSRSSLDVPPMPAQASSLNSKPKNKLVSRSHSPGKVTKVRHNATTSLTDISNAQCPVPSANMFHRIFSGSKVTPAETAPLISVSAPIRRPSHHRSTKSDGRSPLADKPLPDPEPSTSVPRVHAPMPPHIIYTPATPDRPVPSSPTKNHDVKKVSMDPGKRSRSTDAKREKASKGDPTTKSARHGSFDFETPIAGVIPVQRTESGGTDVFSSLSAWNKHNEHAAQERDSSFGPGLAGVGTLQREMSVRRGKEWEEQLRAREVERKKQMQQQRRKKHEQSSSQDVPLVQKDDTGGSTSTVGTGHSSSWGNAAKRSAMSTKTGSGSGLPKVTTLTHHPAFDFEPPVPSSTSWSASSIGMLHDASSSSGEKRSNEKWHQKPKPRLSEERRPSPGPTTAAIGHRSALKGRSLDLGLGLAWAPSSMREEALLPSLNLGRSFSQTSSVKSASECQNAGKSSASTSNGHGKVGSTEDTSKFGKDVAAVFKSTLDRDGFANFKRYVHQFDAHEIPFDGPTGIIARVDQLLGESSTLKQHEKRELMDQLVRIILRNA